MRSKKIKKKLLMIVLLATGLVMLFLKIFSDNISLFLKPAEVYEKLSQIDKEIKIGGYVKDISFNKESLEYSFILTDYNSHEIFVTYKGILPSLFKEGQMSVISAKIEKNTTNDKINVVAREVLAKHDENYRPVSTT
jgi:cytochrome c-type biogenesis protein CcmE